MNEEQRSALLRFTKREISKEEFLGIYASTQPLDIEVNTLIKSAIDSEDGDALWYAFSFMFALRLTPSENEMLELYQKLLPLPWHEQHEDMIRYLQDHPDPSSIVAIDKAIILKPQLGYLEYDDYGSYYKKCFWALTSIGTEDSLGLIHYYCDSEDEVLREQAQYRANKV